ncbi:MAG: type II secretion system F family protein [Phycisphaerales bacterium]
MRYGYKAYDRSGRQVADVIEAPAAAEAEEQLRRQGLFVVEIIERKAVLTGRAASSLVGRSGSVPRSVGGFGRTARLRDVTAFFRQLSVLVSTGTPMVDALEAIERQTPDGQWKTVLTEVRSRVEEGQTFAQALEQHPKYFDAVCRSLVSAGESSGQLDAMLKRLTMLTRQQLKVRSSVAGAMVYPVLLIFVSIGVMGVMMGFVLPRFQGLFESLGAPLPPTTRMLMDLSAWMREYWWAALAGAGLAVYAARGWLVSESGMVWWHRTVLRLPILGKVVRSFVTSRVLRVLGVLLEGKVPLLDALRLTRESTGNLCFADLVVRAEDEVTRGGSMSSVFATSALIGQGVTEAVRSGERTGQVGQVLTDLAEFMDEDNEVILRSLTSIIEPVILIVLGLLVGFVAVSMFLPLFDLTTTTQSGGA